ncbi:MAG: hypothetical protein CVU61_02745 [Deltaproteobacteria bacterium HGW-Deltaproteobacteria-19]|jgi:hypothetical protein|nr:MAG: hypothetical protein CVU61_02745 [Deltaproteobacteria bacterium HGW-Deltaproteobacteria-19]
MSDNIITLMAKGITYYSNKDETYFFKWLESIKCVESHGGELDILYINVIADKVNDKALREMLALFYRYKIDMKQLSIFKSDKNKDWFCKTHAFWHRRVFGKK